MLDDWDDPTDLVAAGYDRVSQEYTDAALRGSEVRERHTRLIVERLEDGSDVLDLGSQRPQPWRSIST